MDDNSIDSALIAEENSTEREWAGFWVRVGAAFVDFAVYIPLTALQFYNYLQIKSLSIALFLIIATALYKPLMEGVYGASVGKMATKLVVLNENFEPITMLQSFVRNGPWLANSLLGLVTAVMVFRNEAFTYTTDFFDLAALMDSGPTDGVSKTLSMMTLISCVVVAFHAKKQGLHDIVAKTYCVYK